MKQSENTGKIIKILQKTYPNAKIVLQYKNPWELLVAVILSAQCTDVTVNKVTARLFALYPTIESYAKANQKTFEKHIKSTGFFRVKAKHIIEAAQMILADFGGEVPKTMEDLLKIPGCARKTANVVLANAYNETPGIAVDTHVLRLSQRLRLVPIDKIGGKHTMFFEKKGKDIIDYMKDADPVKIERYLMTVVPKSLWKSITYELIDHGRAICKAQHPSCNQCPLQILCPSSRV